MGKKYNLQVMQTLALSFLVIFIKTGFHLMDVELSMEDMITMCIIENYLDFKVFYETLVFDMA